MAAASAAFGIGLTGLVASAASGTPLNGAQPSANPGQTITLQGSALDSGTDVVFQVIDAAGNLDDVIVRPTSADVGGSSAQVRVPNNAVTGVVRVAGAAGIVPAADPAHHHRYAGRIRGRGWLERASAHRRHRLRRRRQLRVPLRHRTVLDRWPTTGPDVFGRNDAVLGFVPNGYVV